ncbi:uncharacterized protein FIBRA_02110 [Fibroporia radiculosa]|uniref:AB hydrolase-1 domain-containing protein n=1 Tax=Fibroporia radiculosa TaxID=599839 RepID=J4G1C9_9APHY|nr:uncharacterized protein FIBRA_02110 [Fibroporia radiculosa]CCM00083.1 predicted protein [Fibroporia radiculosa]
MAQERTVTSADGTKIVAEAIGNPSKPSVVFIPGLACTYLVFDKQFNDAELQENLYMVRYDLRGHGRSDCPEGIEAYSAQKMAEDFRAVCEAFGLKKPFLLGWSLGTMMAADVAAYYGLDYLSGQVLLGGPMITLSLGMQACTAELMALAPSVLSTDASITREVAVAYVDGCVGDPAVDLSWETKLQWMGGFVCVPPSVRGYYLQREQDATRYLAEAKEWPVLVIQGTEDKHTRADMVAKQAKETFNKLDIHIMKGVGHAPHWERPDEFKRFVLDYVRNVAKVGKSHPIHTGH